MKNDQFHPGDKIKVLGGTFSGQQGRVVEVHDLGWVRIELIIYGRPVPVEIEGWQIEKLPYFENN